VRAASYRELIEMKRILLAVMLLAGAQAAMADKFEKYPAEVYTGQPAKLNLAKYPSAREYRTRLRAAFAGGVNFAGKYAIVTWGCGMGCSVSTSVNIQTGEVSPFEVPVSGEEFIEASFDYKPNSKLLRANWREGYELCVSREYVLDGEAKPRLRKISERRSRPRGDDGCERLPL